MRSRTYRAACWISRPSREAVPLTGPDLRDLDSRELLAVGIGRATSQGYFDHDGWVEVLPVTGQEDFEVHEVEALCWVSVAGSGTAGQGVLGEDECRRMTEALAEGRARVAGRLQKVDGYTHTVELTHNLDDTLLPFSIAYHARLRLPLARGASEM